MPQKLQPRGISLAGLGHPGTGLFHSHQAQQPVQQAKKQAEAGQKQAGQEVSAWSGETRFVWLAEKAGLG